MNGARRARGDDSPAPGRHGDAERRDVVSTRTGWLLVGVVVAFFVCLPAVTTVVLRGGGVAELGLPWFDSTVALPTLPGLLLGLVGAWTALRETG